MDDAFDRKFSGLILDRLECGSVRNTALANDNVDPSSMHIIYQFCHKGTVRTRSRKGYDVFCPETGKVLDSKSTKAASTAHHQVGAISFQLRSRWLLRLDLQSGVSKTNTNIGGKYTLTGKVVSGSSLSSSFPMCFPACIILNEFSTSERPLIVIGLRILIFSLLARSRTLR